MAKRREQLRTIAERLGGPLMYLAGRGGLAWLGMSLKDLGGLGYKIVADPSTPLLAAYAAWKKIYEELADGFGANVQTKPDWSPVEKDMLKVIDLEKLLAIERATVENGKH
jgi:2-methylisocitrate lyase-like PEP mutase family enzyme